MKSEEIAKWIRTVGKKYKFFKFWFLQGGYIIAMRPSAFLSSSIICPFFIGLHNIPVVNGKIFIQNIYEITPIDIHDYARLSMELVKHGYVYNKKKGLIYKKGYKRPCTSNIHLR